MIESHAVSLRFAPLFIVLSVGKRLHCYPPRNTTFESANYHSILQSLCTAPLILLSRPLIFLVFILTIVILQRHTSCGVTGVKGERFPFSISPRMTESVLQSDRGPCSREIGFAGKGVPAAGENSINMEISV